MLFEEMPNESACRGAMCAQGIELSLERTWKLNVES